jgi:hypothetical protein
MTVLSIPRPRKVIRKRETIGYTPYVGQFTSSWQSAKHVEAEETTMFPQASQKLVLPLEENTVLPQERKEQMLASWSSEVAGSNTVSVCVSGGEAQHD